jgi:hypothetical protein
MKTERSAIRRALSDGIARELVHARRERGARIRRGTTVKFDDMTLAEIQRRFGEGRPSESSKRKRYSGYDVIQRLLTDIERLIAEGYSYEGIAAYLGTLAIDMPPNTLKTYVGRARNKLRTAQRPSSSPRADGAATRRRPKKHPPRPPPGSEPTPPTANSDTVAHTAPDGPPPTSQPRSNARLDSGGSAVDPLRLQALATDSTAQPTLTPLMAVPNGEDRSPPEPPVIKTAAAGSRKEDPPPDADEGSSRRSSRLPTLRTQASPIKNAFIPRTLLTDKDL